MKKMSLHEIHSRMSEEVSRCLEGCKYEIGKNLYGFPSLKGETFNTSLGFLNTPTGVLYAINFLPHDFGHHLNEKELELYKEGSRNQYKNAQEVARAMLRYHELINQ